MVGGGRLRGWRGVNTAGRHGSAAGEYPIYKQANFMAAMFNVLPVDAFSYFYFY